ncbi:MAG TPA: hypothetical protein VGQ20_17600 [Acidimicrobiales bacterium]|jgi:hypothetical protein|nr:hypothetical protein [Acidimicrobiales bacterium]
MRLFQRKREPSAPTAEDARATWPEDSLVEIDDAAFAQAIAAGRASETPQSQLVA